MEAVLKNNLVPLPGPKGLELYKLGMKFQTDPLGTFFHIAQNYGDLVYCPWPNRSCVFIFHPDMIRRVLKENQTNYQKAAEYSHLKPLLGEGLLTSENEHWRNQRRLMAQEFHPESLAEYLPAIKKATEANLATVQTGNYFDMSTIFSRLTFSIAGQIFFGADVESFSGDVKSALDFEMERINKRIRRAWNVPNSFPCPENIKGKKAVRTLDNVVEEIIDHGPSSADQNVLSKLLAKKIPIKSVRDEVMTLLLAGHETTSNTLTWTLWLLCTHPEWQEKLFEELKVMGKEAKDLTLEDLANLKVFKAVIYESMRIRPAIPTISRMSLDKDVLGDYEIPAGVSVQILPYITHRDPRYWENPEAFRPERFFNRLDRRDDFVFMPFARGARSCIGEGLAMAETTLILAYMVEAFKWELKPGFEPVAVHTLTLRSENGVVVKAGRR